MSKESFSPTKISHNEHVNKSVTLLNVVFDNDIFDNTDYYYTNGIYIELLTPVATLSPLSRMLVGVKRAPLNFTGFFLRQNIYTPTNPDKAEVSIGDRPFSAFLTIGQTRQSYSFKKKLSIKSSVSFGVMGPASLGGFVQSSIHNIEPIGWINQINNSFVFDYSINVEKGIFSTPHAELNFTYGGSFGTIFNKFNTGFYFRTGSFLPVYRGSTSVLNASSKSKLQYWFFVSGKSNFVLYDATLQGGLFTSKNNYVIDSDNINRVVAKLSIGFAVYYNKVGFEFQNFYISPEFKNAYDFRWGRIKLIFQI